MTLQSPAGPFGIAEVGCFSMAGGARCVCSVGGPSGMPGIVILIDTSQFPSRMGDVLCAMAVHERPRASRATELKRIFMETPYWKLPIGNFLNSPQPRGAADAARISVRRPHEGSIGMIGEDIRSPSRRNIFIEPLDVRQTAAEYDHVWIDDVDHARERSRHLGFVSLERRARGVVACPGTRRDVRRFDPHIRQLCIGAGETRAGKKRLDASDPPAVAGCAGPLAVRRPWQWVVAPLAGDSMPPFEYLASDHDPGTCTGTDDDAKYRVCALGRPVRRFRQREAVRIIGDANVLPDPARKTGIQRLADEPHRVRVFHQTGLGRHGARNANAHRAGLS